MADMDLPSDSDESDVDFVPQGEESSDGPSENEDALEDENGESALPKKGKRPASSKAKTKSKRSRKDTDEECAPVEAEEVKSINTVVDKKSEDDLWASFLTDSPKDKKSEVETTTSTETISKIKDNSIDDTLNAKNSVKNKILGNRPAAGAKGGGLSSILNKIGKANKVSTLEKSKMDWINFKKDQDIEEEISTHNRGREGYLERQDFLQRTDLRQFEIEKNLRTNKRSNR